MKRVPLIPRVKSQFPLLILSLISFLLLLSAYFLYLAEKKSIQKSVQAELKSIANLKTRQIDHWIEERKINALLLSESPFFIDIARQVLNDKGNDELRYNMLKILLPLKEEYGYSDVFLFTTEGDLLLSTDSTEVIIDSLTKTYIEETIRNKKSTMSGFYFCSTHNEIHLDITTPFLDNDGLVFAALILRIDPQDFLYPYIQTWPIPSKSAETLIVRQEGDSVLFLNGLRFKADAALKMKISLSEKDVPAVQVVIGKTGYFDGYDYRGVKVVSYIEKIPGTPWFIIAKVNKDEIYKELYVRALFIGLFAILLIALVGTGYTIKYKNRQKDTLQQLLDREIALGKSQEEHKAVLYSIGDAVITTNTEGIINRMNPVAEKLTGWSETEGRGSPVDSVFCIINEETGEKVDSPIERIISKGIVSGFTNHTLLISKEGMEIPITENGASIKDEKGELIGVVVVFRDQTEERNHQKALIENEKWLRSLLDNMLEGCQILDFNWKYLYINHAAEIHNTRPKEELLGKIYKDMWPGIEKTEIYKIIEKSLVERIHSELENRFVFPDGKVGWFILKIQPIPEGVLILSIDITNRKKNFEIIQKNLGELEVRNNINDVFLTVSGEEMYTPILSIILNTLKSKFGVFGFIDEAGNLVVPTMTGTIWDKCQITDKRFIFLKETWSDSSWATAIREKRLVYSNNPSTNIPQGHIAISRHISLPILHNNNVIGLIQVANKETDYTSEDISLLKMIGNNIAPILHARLNWEREELRRKNTEEDLRNLNLKLENLVKERTSQLETTNKELEAFSYSVSHDLRAPLRHVSGYVDLLENRFLDSLPDKARHYLESITDSVKDMGQLIDDLLQFSRTGRQEIHFSRFSMDEAVKEIVETLKNENEERNIKWKLTELPEVFGDYSLLKLVWYNLLSNAVKFTAQKENAKIEIGYQHKESEFIFNVKDNGAGFDMQYAHKLFGVFQRLHSVSEYQGTGIGLANVRRIINKHGGRTWAEGQINKGAAFYFTIKTNLEEKS